MYRDFNRHVDVHRTVHRDVYRDLYHNFHWNLYLDWSVNRNFDVLDNFNYFLDWYLNHPLNNPLDRNLHNPIYRNFDSLLDLNDAINRDLHHALYNAIHRNFDNAVYWPVYRHLHNPLWAWDCVRAVYRHVDLNRLLVNHRNFHNLLMDVMLVIHLRARHLTLHIDDLWWLPNLDDLLRHLWLHHLPLHRGRHGTHRDWMTESLARGTSCVHLTHLIHSEPVLCVHSS